MDLVSTVTILLTTDFRLIVFKCPRSCKGVVYLVTESLLLWLLWFNSNWFCFVHITTATCTTAKSPHQNFGHSNSRPCSVNRLQMDARHVVHIDTYNFHFPPATSIT